jgi:hypothetical protein
MWETCDIDVWGTTRDLGFPVTRDSPIVKSARDAAEGRPEKEWWAGTEMGLLRACQFPGHVTTSDVSVGTGCMGAGFVWLDQVRERAHRTKGGKYKLGESGDGSIRSDPSTHSVTCGVTFFTEP